MCDVAESDGEDAVMYLERTPYVESPRKSSVQKKGFSYVFKVISKLSRSYLKCFLSTLKSHLEVIPNG